MIFRAVLCSVSIWEVRWFFSIRLEMEMPLTPKSTIHEYHCFFLIIFLSAIQSYNPSNTITFISSHTYGFRIWWGMRLLDFRINSNDSTFQTFNWGRIMTVTKKSDFLWLTFYPCRQLIFQEEVLPCLLRCKLRGWVIFQMALNSVEAVEGQIWDLAPNIDCLWLL